ncbi:MAG: hypothetical protein M1816_000033 [Peltula sp. TS41687]|nr:MAG: hypothetical protein M1816_000033 [Peltula sp. TS41687]
MSTSTEDSPPSPDYTVMAHTFQTAGDQLRLVPGHMERAGPSVILREMREGFAVLNRRLDGIEQRLDRVEQRLNRIEQRAAAAHYNHVAQVQNSLLKRGNESLVSPHALATNEPIAGFPSRPSGMTDLPRPILRALELPDEGTLDDQRSRLRAAVGLSPF